MARRIMNRKELREGYDAAERQEQDEDEAEEQDEDSDDAEEKDEAEAEPSEETEAEAEADEEAPKKKAAAKAKPRSRSRAAKITRLKVVWGVFNNSNQRVAVFDYPKRQDAEELAAKLRADKKSTFFVQAVKEPIEEKKEG
jgi:hypothetical protein